MRSFSGSFVSGIDRGLTSHDLERIRRRFATALAPHVTATSRVIIAIADHALFVCAAAAARDVGAVAVLLSSNATRVADLVPRIADADADLALLDSRHAEGLRSEFLALELCEDTSDIWFGRRTAERIPHPREAAYLVYTSGSEGPPKGVLHSQRAIDFMLEVNQRVNRWTACDSVLSALPLSHLAGFVTVVAALNHGAFAVASPGFDFMGDLLETCIAHRVSVLGLVPFYFGRMVAHERFREMTALRLVVLSAAPVVVGDVERAVAIHPALQFSNCYGLTEAFRSTILAPAEIPRALPSIGRPVDEVEVRLHAADGRALDGDDAVGIAHIRGPNVMLGYWRRSPGLVDGWFRSADVLRRDASGRFWLEGRNQELINGGGEKLGARAIEDCIRATCHVEDVCALGIETREGRDEVVVVAVPRAGSALTLSDIRGACARRLHSAFIPARLIITGSIPRTGTGKVDRRSLLDLVRASTALPRIEVPQSVNRALAPFTAPLEELPVVNRPFARWREDALAAAAACNARLELPANVFATAGFVRAFCAAAGGQSAQAAVELGAVHEGFGANVIALGEPAGDLVAYPIYLRAPGCPSAPRMVTVPALGTVTRTAQPGRSEFPLVRVAEPNVAWAVAHWSDLLAVNLLALPYVLAEVAGAGERAERTEIHATAVIEGSRIGTGARIGPFCYIKDAIIGEGAVIEENVSIARSVVGAGTSIQAYAQIRDSVIGEGSLMGFRTSTRSSVVFDRTTVSAWIVPRSIIGSDAFVGRETTFSISTLQNTIVSVIVHGKPVMTGTRTLGAAIGDGARVSNLELSCGYQVPAGVYVSRPGIPPIPSDVPTHTPIIEANGRFRSFAKRKNGHDQEPR